MKTIDELAGILGGDAGPLERRTALRQAHPDREALDALLHRAVQLRSRNPTAARQIAASALAAGRVGRLADVTTNATRILAQAHIVLGEPRRALRHLQRLDREVTPRARLNIVVELAQTLSLLGRGREARQAVSDERERLPARGAARERALLDLAEASILTAQGDLEEALALMERGRRTMARLGHRAMLPRIDINRATTLTSLGKYERADHIYRRGARALRRSGERASALQAEYNHAVLFVMRGQFHRALRRFRSIRGQFVYGSDQRHVAHCDMAEAEVDLALNLPTQAVALALRAAETFERLGLRDDQARANFFAAVAARALGRTVEAFHRMEQARTVFARSGCRTWEALCLHRLAESDLDLGETGRAAARASQAAERLHRLGMHERAGHAEVLLARIELEVGEVEPARQRLLKLIREMPAPHSPWLLCEAHHQLALVEEVLGHLRPAVGRALRATRILERFRAAVPPDEYMAAFLTGRARLFEDAVRLVLRLRGRRSAVRAFELTEQARARALLDLLRGRTATPRRVADRALVREVETLGREIEGRAVRMPDLRESREAPSLGGQLHEVTQREHRLRHCLDRLARSAPDAARTRRGAPVHLEDLARRLPPGEALLEFYLSGDELLTFIVHDGKLELRRRRLQRSALRRLLSRMRFQLDRPTLDRDDKLAGDDGPLRSARAVLEELHELLIGPELENLACRRLVIVPHAELHCVPFPALERNGRALIDDCEVVLAPSAAIYLYCLEARTNRGRNSLLIGLADAVAPKIRDEIRQLSPLLPRASVRVGDQATTRTLTDEGRRARIIHIAAHTQYRHDDPMESRIRLADGWLTIPRIYELRLRPELLVLSGCATGRVAVTGGGDLFGLVRGFLHAGAPSILTSLWEVSDERNTEYMRHFYEALDEEGCAASAMRRASLELRAQHPHPYHWAPFVLTGRGGRIERPRGRPSS